MSNSDSRAQKRLYYTIGEAAKMVGVKPSVLRFWETEFPFLRPRKNRSGNRAYRPADLKRAMLVRRLLHEEGFTIAGARRRLAQAHDDDQMQLWVEGASASAVLDSIRGDIAALVEVLERGQVAADPQGHGDTG